MITVATPALTETPMDWPVLVSANNTETMSRSMTLFAASLWETGVATGAGKSVKNLSAAAARFGLEAQTAAKVSGSASQRNILHLASRCPGSGAAVVPALRMEFVDMMFVSFLMFISFVYFFML